jgi:hypothetical protein
MWTICGVCEADRDLLRVGKGRRLGTEQWYGYRAQERSGDDRKSLDILGCHRWEVSGEDSRKGHEDAISVVRPTGMAGSEPTNCQLEIVSYWGSWIYQ